jgi:hypothetical protein
MATKQYQHKNHRGQLQKKGRTGVSGLRNPKAARCCKSTPTRNYHFPGGPTYVQYFCSYVILQSSVITLNLNTNRPS